MKDGEKVFVECACLQEGIKVGFLYDEDLRLIEFQYLTYPGQYNPWRWRLQSIWRILRYGDCQQDWVSIEKPEDLRRLANFLNRAADTIERPDDTYTIGIRNQRTGRYIRKSERLYGEALLAALEEGGSGASSTFSS